MSWLWGNETTEQAQIVVGALQGELDERESKIQALEAALRREQQDFTSLLQDEVKELETRRAGIEKELAAVDALIKEKQRLILRAKDGGRKKKKKSKKPKPDADGAVTTTSTSTPKSAPAASEGEAKPAAGSTKPKKKPLKKKKSSGAASAGASSETALLMDENLQMVAKAEPNVAFIIQRSTNANTVVYAGQKTAAGALDPEKPLAVYWIMYEKPDAPTEELNMIERNTAYGVTCSSSDMAGEFTAAIASLRDRDCMLKLDAHGNVMALTTIGGQKGMLLRRVYVQMTTSWGIPTVNYVEIFGVHPETFEPAYEKKKN